MLLQCDYQMRWKCVFVCIRNGKMTVCGCAECTSRRERLRSQRERELIQAVNTNPTNYNQLDVRLYFLPHQRSFKYYISTIQSQRRPAVQRARAQVIKPNPSKFIMRAERRLRSGLGFLFCAARKAKISAVFSGWSASAGDTGTSRNVIVMDAARRFIHRADDHQFISS